MARNEEAGSERTLPASNMNIRYKLMCVIGGARPYKLMRLIGMGWPYPKTAAVFMVELEEL